MDTFKTPVKPNKMPTTLKIPASPFLKKIGFGTGVAVYEMKRSPISNKIRSPWAIKKLIKRTTKESEELDKRIYVEAEVLRKLNHPNIIGFRALCKSRDGRHILAMEECTSCLGNMIEERQDENAVPFPAKIIAKVAKDIVKALDYLHNTALILHCDIKSYNILIKNNFKICKLCDFGISLPLTKEGILDKSKVKDEEVIEYSGTPAWSSPEVLKFPAHITDRADIYAFGLVIWEMIALSPPVDEDDVNMDNDVEITPTRKRPNLPEINLTDDYDHVLELYFICTTEDLIHRPTAKILNQIIV